ncbi:hypothetical protein IFM89_039908 [Coptis chinensis]|uniref:Fcf2 pre-rRNA processing C-terminal domain-containing protein n=1 Tax=Coptis chinensis TaxID=261450 RepID=A0A835L9E2_9MAGN|nr:hypothetical protein IFM89_039908 [Coptis chinensis]
MYDLCYKIAEYSPIRAREIKKTHSSSSPLLQLQQHSSSSPLLQQHSLFSLFLLENAGRRIYNWPNMGTKNPHFTSSETIPSGSRKLESSPQNLVWKPDIKLIDGLFVPPNDPRKLNKLIRKQRKDTTGSNWFDMPAPTITPEIKRDLQILKLRSALDPKRHYKKSDSKSKTLPKYFQASILCYSCVVLLCTFFIALINSWVILSFNQVGTVIESASDFFSGRLTKKERKETLANELLADHSLTKYRKRKIREIEEQKRPVGVEKWKNKGRQSWKRAKDRRH